MVNLARLIGPAISGLVLENLGAGICFLLNALSFVSVIASILLMRFPEYIPVPQPKKVIREFKEGLKYLKRTRSIGYIMLMLACVSLMVLPFITLLPAYAKIIFNGNASTFGYLNSTIGLGAIGGAIFLASLRPEIELKRILFINLIIFGAGLMLFSHLTCFPLALFAAMLSGFGMMSQSATPSFKQMYPVKCGVG